MNAKKNLSGRLFQFSKHRPSFFFSFVFFRPWDQGQASTTERPFIQSVRPDWNQPSRVQKIFFFSSTKTKNIYRKSKAGQRWSAFLLYEGAMSTGTPWRLLQDWGVGGWGSKFSQEPPKVFVVCSDLWRDEEKKNTYFQIHTHTRKFLREWRIGILQKKTNNKIEFDFIFRTFEARRCNCFFRVSPVGTGSNLPFSIPL